MPYFSVWGDLFKNYWYLTCIYQKWNKLLNVNFLQYFHLDIQLLYSNDKSCLLVDALVILLLSRYENTLSWFFMYFKL